MTVKTRLSVNLLQEFGATQSGAIVTGIGARRDLLSPATSQESEKARHMKHYLSTTTRLFVLLLEIGSGGGIESKPPPQSQS